MEAITTFAVNLALNLAGHAWHSRRSRVLSNLASASYVACGSKGRMA
jgi:hypothetical protein